MYAIFCLQTFSLAGLGAGVTEAIFVNPFEVVKVSLQTNKSQVQHVPSTWAVTRAIVREHVSPGKLLNFLRLLSSEVVEVVV